MAIVTILIVNAAISAGCFLILWLISLRIRDVSFIDSWWAVGIVVIAVATHFETKDVTPGGVLLLGLIVAWGLRLGIHLFIRWRRNGPDPRYVAIMRSRETRFGWSFAKTAGIQVFGLQSVLQFVVSLAVQFGQIAGAPAIGVLGSAGIVLALGGILFETVADAQLESFRADPSNKQRVLDSGLWRYTRHPNYFGDVCTWWGLYLIAAQTLPGALTFVSPVLVTILLTRVSGVPMLEHGLKRKRPGYDEYIARTSTFFPWPPKRA
jgi:steroid 5-alpha reductase family enzyme